MTTNPPFTITRIFNAPPEKVYAYWTQPDLYKKWFGPKDFTCPAAELNVSVGGTYLSCMRSPDGQDFWSTGTYKEIIPNKKIVCSDSFADEEGNIIPASDYGMPGEWPLELTVTVIFEYVDGKTLMTLTHEGMPLEMHEDCKNGWNQSFDKLEADLEK